MSEPRTERDLAIDALLELTACPADRLWRYPIARWMLRGALHTPITPHHITAVHAALGIASGALVAQGTVRAWVLAGALFEVRSILDCFDGVVARAKGMSSPLGRALDELADGMAFLALMCGTAVCMARLHGWPLAAAVAFLCTLLAANGTTAWDLFKRRFTSLLRVGRDTTEDEYLLLVRDLTERPGVALGFAWLMASWQWLTLAPSALARMRERARQRDWPVAGEAQPPTAAALSLQAAAERGDPELRAALLRVGFVGGDNVMLLLTAGLLVGRLLEVFVLSMAYMVVAWAVTVVSVNRVLHGAAERAHQQG